MSVTLSYEEKTEKQNDRFVKKSLKHERLNFLRSLTRRIETQTLFSDLADGQAESFEDKAAAEAFTGVNTEFQVMQYSVPVRNTLLYDILSRIGEKERNIILMALWLEMTDQEISGETGLKRRTVNEIRNRTYKKLKEMLEADGYDANNFFPTRKP